MNPYDVLGVSPHATMPEIQARYRLLLREYHPDLHQGKGPEAIAEMEAKTRELNRAIEAVRASIPVQEHPYRPPRDATGWERHRGASESAADAGSTRQGKRTEDAAWDGRNPFWQYDDEPGPGGHANFGHYYDWFGNPVEYGTEDPVPCPYCGRPYERLDDFEVHLEQVHRYRAAPPPRKVPKPPGKVLRTIGALRFIPGWMAGLMALSVWVMFGFVPFLCVFPLVAVVFWTQTSPRFRRR